MIPTLKKKTGRIIALAFILPGSSLLLTAFFTGNYISWKASQGPDATAIVLSKSDELPRKGFVHTYCVQLAFAIPAIDSFITETEVSHADFLALSVRDRVAIHYDRQNPRRALLASEHWFDWKSLPVLLLGLSLLWAAIEVSKTRQTR